LAEARAATHHAAPNNHAGLIWAIADLLRGDYKQSEYGRVILPLVLLRALDCVLEPTKSQVLARGKTLTVQTVGPVLKTVTGIEADNTSGLNLRSSLLDR
jgi:type I restriction enzyme M protein